MKTLSLLPLFICGLALTTNAEDTNAAPKTSVRLQSLVKRSDASPTNAQAGVVTNSVVASTNAPRFQDRLQTIVRRGTNQPVQNPANKP